MNRSVFEFENRYPGQIAYVVGKGPSLQWLKPEHIGEGPVITINEAIGKVESLNIGNDVFSFFKDGCKVYDERPDSFFKQAHHCMMPLSTKNAPTFVQDFEAPYCFKDYRNRVGFDNQKDFGISHWIPSAPTIISFVKLLGCRRIVWLCMDSFVTGDISSYASKSNGECQYLNRQSSYYQHREMVYGELERLGIEHEWVIPKATESQSNKIKLLIATPFYPFYGYSGYIRSLFQLATMLSQIPQIEFNFLELTGHCYVDNVRNTIASGFLQSDYTDLLFYDSDMEVNAEGFANLISSQEEIVGGVYRRKNRWQSYTGDIFKNEDGTPVVNENGLIKARNLPTGLMKIKRTALEKMAQHYVNEFYYEQKVTEDGEKLAPIIIHNFFGNIISYDHRTYFGEDTSFCIRWREMGGDLWIEPRISIKHYGLKSYEGNFDKFLRGLPSPEEVKRRSLNAIFKTYGSDKGHDGHCYGEFYEKILNKFVGKSPRLLEIGLNINGTDKIPSLLAWREYLQNAEIVGFDIRDFRHLAHGNIHIEQGSQSSTEDLKALVDKYSQFDIVVDEGSPKPADKIRAFESLFPVLRDGGVYTAEDIIEPDMHPLVEHLTQLGLEPQLFESTTGPHKMLCVKKEQKQ